MAWGFRARSHKHHRENNGPEDLKKQPRMVVNEEIYVITLKKEIYRAGGRNNIILCRGVLLKDVNGHEQCLKKEKFGREATSLSTKKWFKDLSMENLRASSEEPCGHEGTTE